MAATDASVISDPSTSESIRNPLNDRALKSIFIYGSTTEGYLS